MDLTVLAGVLLLGLVVGFLIKPSTITTTTITTTIITTTKSITLTLTSTTISKITTLITSIITTIASVTLIQSMPTVTLTSYYPSTVYKIVTVPSITAYTTRMTKFETLTNTFITSLTRITTITVTNTVTTVSTVTIYPQEVPKANLPYLGPSLYNIYKLLNDLRKTYKALSSKSNPIVEQFRKAMQVKFKLVAEILNIQNDLNLLVRYYKDLVDSDKALAELSGEELNYNNVYKGYMYLLNMKVDMAMIDSTLNKLGEKIRGLLNQMPAQSYLSVESVLGEGVESFLLNVSRPMNALQALPLMKRAKEAGGPSAVVNAYLSKVIAKLSSEYESLLRSWSKAKGYFEAEYQKYYKMFSNIPG